MLSTPILLLIFNRPDVTLEIFNAVKKAQPKRLYIAADGPRSNRQGESKLCNQARDIINHVDWDCEVFTLFRDENLGCKIAVTRSINWFFENEEEGIILEDDCLPDLSFFSFCENLLEKYRLDTRVMMISGFNAFPEKHHENSYFFSRLGSVWGWASWKRAWKFYDIEMSAWPQIEESNLFEEMFQNERFVKERKSTYSQTYRNLINSWAYRWSFARLIHNGLSIIPSHNLIKNIGFGSEATHTKNINDKNSFIEISPLRLPLKHPPYMITDYLFDKKLLEEASGTPPPKRFSKKWLFLKLKYFNDK